MSAVRDKSSDVSEHRRLLRCVNCAREMPSLYVQYSPGNIRLMKCEYCRAVADPYIECEFMIILIDLILHKRKAYRHLLFNMLNLGGDDKEVVWKSSLLYFILDVCRYYLLKSSEACFDSSTHIMMSILTCGKVLLNVILGNLIFMSALFLGTRFLLKLSFNTVSYSQILLAVLISTYFRLYLIAMLVWEFPSSVLYIIDLLVLSSNALALGVVTESQTAGCLIVCLGAHVAKFFSNHWLLHLLSGPS
ncbi:protein ARV 2-like isoform X1 [Zingiber officinale]|uniref:protein ARV 2-like isoform X1 n=1 Tax=Zingiber officinale TaxID=94328 RepID=UPI001C4C7322|nr:protein ARV 2-like isoform X1 [Zingiber officinale]